ncbi:hypothetical protein ACFPRL_15425 [Pseudoclavibacter helvolus]
MRGRGLRASECRDELGHGRRPVGVRRDEREDAQPRRVGEDLEAVCEPVRGGRVERGLGGVTGPRELRRRGHAHARQPARGGASCRGIAGCAARRDRVRRSSAPGCCACGCAPHA